MIKNELTKEQIDKIHEISCDYILTSLDLFLMGYTGNDEYYKNELKKVADKY
jgi:hypothetical protein